MYQIIWQRQGKVHQEDSAIKLLPHLPATIGVFLKKILIKILRKEE